MIFRPVTSRVPGLEACWEPFLSRQTVWIEFVWPVHLIGSGKPVELEAGFAVSRHQGQSDRVLHSYVWGHFEHRLDRRMVNLWLTSVQLWVVFKTRVPLLEECQNATMVLYLDTASQCVRENRTSPRGCCDVAAALKVATPTPLTSPPSLSPVHEQTHEKEPPPPLVRSPQVNEQPQEEPLEHLNSVPGSCGVGHRLIR